MVERHTMIIIHEFWTIYWFPFLTFTELWRLFTGPVEPKFILEVLEGPFLINEVRQGALGFFYFVVIVVVLDYFFDPLLSSVSTPSYRRFIYHSRHLGLSYDFW